MSEEAELIEISGRISSVIYANEENGYTVLRLDTLDGGLTTVVGTLPSAYPGEELRAYGEWVTHPNHGRQFKCEYAERSLPRTKEGIYAYLAGHAVKGIGPATAAVIVDKFGDRTLDVLENHPDELAALLEALFDHDARAHKRRARILDELAKPVERAALGEEVVDEVMDGDRSLCWDEAENREHSIRAILAYLCPKTEEDAAAADAAEARMNAVLAKIGK